MGKHGIPEKAKRSTKNHNEQEIDAVNLYHALVDNGDEMSVVEAVDHAIFTTGATWKVASGAIFRAENEDIINVSWNGKISKPQNSGREE